eukprot:Gb_16835 [translate_table: standard]
MIDPVIGIKACSSILKYLATTPLRPIGIVFCLLLGFENHTCTGQVDDWDQVQLEECRRMFATVLIIEIVRILTQFGETMRTYLYICEFCSMAGPEGEASFEILDIFLSKNTMKTAVSSTVLNTRLHL